MQIISNALATLPLHVFEQQIADKREAKRKAIDHALYTMLRLRPNPEMTSHTLRRTIECHCLLWGNGYIEIARNEAAQPIALWPRNPAHTRPVRLTVPTRIEGTTYPAGTLMYQTSEIMGDEISPVDEGRDVGPSRLVLEEDMIHLPGLSLDGRVGQSTVWLARQIIGLALASEKSAAKFFANGAVPRGVLTLPGVLDPKSLENLRRSWQEAHGGENQSKTAVLEKGITYTPIGAKPEEAQLTQTREFQRKVICSIFNVPVHMIGEGSSSKSTVEQTSIEFLNLCIGPRLDSWEQELKIKLFPIEKAKTAPYFAKFDTRWFRYPDAASRAAYYQAGRAGGWLNSNDIRELEDMNPITDGSGDIYWAPVNVVDAATGMLVGQDQEQEGDGPKVELPQGGAPQNNALMLSSVQSRYTRIFYKTFCDATGRILKRDEIDELRFTRCFQPTLLALIEALSIEKASGKTPIASSEFSQEVKIYLEGMRFNLQGLRPEHDETYAARELQRAIETWLGIISKRYEQQSSS